MTKAALRKHVLHAVATASSLSALVALLDPDRVAAVMGLFLVGVNGYSQFYAIYVGVRLATAVLALSAVKQGDQPLLTDLTAMFLLAQPAGRLAVASVIGLPQGPLLVVSVVEIACGLLLLALRPAPINAPRDANDIRPPQSKTHHR
ncbi:hypothetical protein [Pseudoduganella sp. GCM10020061]|uniref:hypothetical protein n=1 Tax=Pseudoduganella sp. GCM10020061 TaxID=3317345 RepID=UPI00363B7338